MIAESEYLFNENTESKNIETNAKLYNDVIYRCHAYVPGWKCIPVDRFRLNFSSTPISGGLTNLLHLIKIDAELAAEYSAIESCVLRIFGRSEFTNRATESIIVKVVSDCKLSETVFHEWPVGRIASYIPGEALMPEQFATEKVASLVAKRLGQLHALSMDILKPSPETPISNVKTTMEVYSSSWTNMAYNTDLYMKYKTAKEVTPEIFEGLSLQSVQDIANLPVNLRKLIEPHFQYRSTENNDEFPETVLEELPVPNATEMLQLMALIDVERIDREVQWLSRKCRELNLPIDFCHNDCHGYNCMYEAAEKTGKDVDSCILIDYEYAGLNFRGFDLANSIAETTIRYTGPYPSFRIDMHRQNELLAPVVQPSSSLSYSKFEKAFLTNFIEGYNATIIENTLPHSLNPVLDISIDDLAREAAWLQLGTNLQWTIWSVPLADKSTIAFGYLEYAIIRLCMYLTWKEKLLAMEAALVADH